MNMQLLSCTKFYAHVVVLVQSANAVPGNSVHSVNLEECGYRILIEWIHLYVNMAKCQVY